MDIVYIGDFRELPNWGCRSTGIALSELISQSHNIIDAYGVETLHWTGWHSYAEPGIRYSSSIPNRIFDFVWRRRSSRVSFANGYFQFERALGAKLDFISEDPGESLREFHIARKSIPRLQELFFSVSRCDAIVINGEGTMIFSSRPRRDVLFNLFVIALGNQLGKRVYFLNAMFSECPYTGLNHKTAMATAELLSTCEAVVCRDRVSYEVIQEFKNIKSITTIPDALFSWTSRIRTTAGLIPHSPDMVLPYHFERLIGKLSFDQPYICVSGTSSAYRKGATDCVSAYEQVVNALNDLGLPIFLVCTCVGDSFLHSVSQRTGKPVIPYQIPVMAGAGILARAAVFISGRFHPSIMASAGGTPCVFLGANSHKTQSLQDVLEYETQTSYSDIPLSDEIPSIVSTAKEKVLAGESLRSRIRSVVDRRRQQALLVQDVLNGQSVNLVL